MNAISSQKSGNSTTDQLPSVEVQLRMDLMSDEVKTWVYNQWTAKHGSQSMSNNGVSVFSQPYKFCSVSQLISDSSFVESLKSELLGLEFEIKSNDLFQYRQSADLFSIDLPAINSLTIFLRGSVHAWLKEVTKMNLEEKVSATCSCYDDTDYLLCHDDQCEDRCLAFILYLNKEWKEEDGGALQLFNSVKAQPSDVTESVLPQFNTFVFFEVSDKSFHQVQEVFTKDKTRITVNGWFYGPRKKVTKKSSVYLPRYSSVTISKFELSVYSKILNKTYDESTLSQLNAHFEQNSSIILECFFCEEFYDECCQALSSKAITWLRKGPINQRFYDVADESTLNTNMKILLKFLRSEKLFNLLTLLTCLDLIKKVKGSGGNSKIVKTSLHSFEIRRWKAGYYTLVTDDSLSKENLLDITVYFNCRENNSNAGNTVYIAPEEEEPLLSAFPRPNSIAVTYREANTACFVKYINHHFQDVFYTINFSCLE